MCENKDYDVYRTNKAIMRKHEDELRQAIDGIIADLKGDEQ
jgi:hypothetical protein